MTSDTAITVQGLPASSNTVSPTCTAPIVVQPNGVAIGVVIDVAGQLRAAGALPSEAEIRATRKLVMIEAHLVALIPLAAVFLARGFGG